MLAGEVVQKPAYPARSYDSVQAFINVFVHCNTSHRGV